MYLLLIIKASTVYYLQQVRKQANGEQEAHRPLLSAWPFAKGNQVSFMSSDSASHMAYSNAIIVLKSRRLTEKQ